MYRPPARRRGHFLADESGSATVEWTVAVAIVVLTAVPVLALIGRGSEVQSGRIAITIQMIDDMVADAGPEGLADPDAPTAPEGVADGDPPVPAAPGSDLGVGFAGQAPDSPLAGLAREAAGFHSAALGVLRRDKPVDTPRRPGSAARGATLALAAADPAVNLPRMPDRRVVFTASECLDPIDHDSITEARYEHPDVVMSGR